MKKEKKKEEFPTFQGIDAPPKEQEKKVPTDLGVSYGGEEKIKEKFYNP